MTDEQVPGDFPERVPLSGYEFRITVRIFDDSVSRGELIAGESFAAAEIRDAMADAIDDRIVSAFDGDGWTEIDVESDVITR